MLSRRERIMGITSILIVAALAADRLVLTPVTERLQQLEAQKQQLLAEVNEAHSLFDRRKLMEKKWQTLQADGLKTESEVESRILHSLDSWAQESKLTLTSVKPQRTSATKEGLQEVLFSVASSGSLEAATRFLWYIEKATLPVRIEDIQLGSANESGGRMSLQLRLSALYLGAPEQQLGGEDDRDG